MKDLIPPHERIFDSKELKRERRVYVIDTVLCVIALVALIASIGSVSLLIKVVYG